MRKLLAFALFLLASPLAAQETYSLPASAGNVSELTTIIDRRHNRPLCVRLGQVPTCNQAQACTAATAPGGASCTPAQARGANARIFPATQAGREEYVTFQITLPSFLAMRGAIVADAQEQQCINWQTFNQTQRDAACVASGLSAGCILCN